MGNGIRVFFCDRLQYPCPPFALTISTSRCCIAIRNDTEIVLLTILDRLFDEYLLDDDAFRNLVCFQQHTQHGSGDLLGLLRRVRHLDAPCLAAPAGVDLRLNTPLPPSASTAARTSWGDGRYACVLRDRHPYLPAVLWPGTHGSSQYKLLFPHSMFLTNRSLIPHLPAEFLPYLFPSSLPTFHLFIRRSLRTISCQDFRPSDSIPLKMLNGTFFSLILSIT